jgi:two-component system, NarL family, invasion response regulator UvrY
MKPNSALNQPQPEQMAGKQTPPGLQILMADDHALIRKGLKQVLADAFPNSQIGEASNAREALTMAAMQPWDALLLDITMPGQSGLDVLKQFKQMHPKTPVLVLSMHPEDQYAMRALKAGASGYLTKNTASELVAAALRKVLSGGTYISQTLAEDLAHRLSDPVAPAPYQTLSDREYQIMSLLASGKSVKEISFELGLSVKTVSTYRTRLLKKLRLTTTAELIRYAIREGLVH